MLEIDGNIFDFINENDVDAICITTNGIFNYQGLAVMGAGTAGEASKKWENIRKNLGDHLKANGNIPGIIGMLDENLSFHNYSENIFKQGTHKLIISFPTKNHFKNDAELSLIENSAKNLVKIIDNLKLKKIIIPAPGVGKYTGKLVWKDVKEKIMNILDDKFYICFYNP